MQEKDDLIYTLEVGKERRDDPYAEAGKYHHMLIKLHGEQFSCRKGGRSSVATGGHPRAGPEMPVSWSRRLNLILMALGSGRRILEGKWN